MNKPRFCPKNGKNFPFCYLYFLTQSELYHIVLGHNILSDKEIILVGLGELIEVVSMVEPLVAGPLTDVEDLLPGSYRINNSFVDLDPYWICIQELCGSGSVFQIPVQIWIHTCKYMIK